MLVVLLPILAVPESPSAPTLAGVPTTLRLMLEDADSLAGAGEFDIARELVAAVSSHSDSSMIRSLTKEWSLRIDHMQYGANDRVASPEGSSIRSHIARIPNVAPDNGHVARIARGFEPVDDNSSAMLLSHRETTVPARSIPSTEHSNHFPASTHAAATTPNESTAGVAELPVESRSVPLLENLARSFGISTNARSSEGSSHRAHHAATPTIIINPPSHAPTPVTPSLNTAYSSEQVTYVSAFCFAIGLLMCPAALLVGMATARRVAGRSGPLFQISVIREDSLPHGTPTFKHDDISAGSQSEDSPQHETQPVRDDIYEANADEPHVANAMASDRDDKSSSSPRILSMAIETAQTEGPIKTKSSNIFRQIVDHNVVLQQNNYRPIVDHS